MGFRLGISGNKFCFILDSSEGFSGRGGKGGWQDGISWCEMKAILAQITYIFLAVGRMPAHPSLL